MKKFPVLVLIALLSSALPGTNSAYGKADRSAGQNSVSPTVQSCENDLVVLEKSSRDFASLFNLLKNSPANLRRNARSDAISMLQSAAALRRDAQKFVRSWKSAETDLLRTQNAIQRQGMAERLKAVLSNLNALQETVLGAPSGSGDCLNKIDAACNKEPCLNCCNAFADDAKRAACQARCEYKTTLCLLKAHMEKETDNIRTPTRIRKDP